MEVSGVDKNDLSLCEPVILDLEPRNLVINVNQCIGTEEEIATAAEAIASRYSGRIVVHASGCSHEQSLIKSLVVAGISAHDFIFAESLGARRRELERIMSVVASASGDSNGMYTETSIPADREGDATEIPEGRKESQAVKTIADSGSGNQNKKKIQELHNLPENAAQIMERRESAVKKIDAELPRGLQHDLVKPSEYIEKRTIAIVGSMHRIGTTTIALQVAKFFAAEGSAVCYIEQNNTGFVRDVEAGYTDIEKGEEPFFVRYGGIDLYDDPAKIASIKKKGYDVIIYDYGNITEQEQHLPSALEKDVLICVLGIKPGELGFGEWIYGRMTPYGHRAMYYAFNFVHKNEREEVYDSMEYLKEFVIFPAFSPDPFILSGENIEVFSTLFGNKNAEEPEKKKKRRLFSR
jgi:hypothetical protein